MNRREFIKGTVLTGVVISVGMATKQQVTGVVENKAKIRRAELWLLKTGRPHLDTALTQTVLDVL